MSALKELDSWLKLLNDCGRSRPKFLYISPGLFDTAVSELKEMGYFQGIGDVKLLRPMYRGVTLVRDSRRDRRGAAS